MYLLRMIYLEDNVDVKGKQLQQDKSIENY